MKILFLLLVATLLLITDYFLYVTGNYSLIYGLLGGWFIINSIALIIIFSYTIKRSFKTGHQWFSAIYIIVVLLFSVSLYNVSDIARGHAKEYMSEVVSEILNSGLDDSMDFTDETEKHFKEISGVQYELAFETFIPTRRRIDYLLKVGDKKKFRLIVIKKRDNRSQVYLADAVSGPVL